MAVTDQQKLDFLLKKIGYTKTKTGSVVGTGAISGTGKQPFAEAIPSPLVVPNSSLWNEAGSIPATPPGSDTAQVKVYLAATSGLRMTADATSSGSRAFIAYSTYNDTSSTRLTNWIDTQFGAGYLIKVYKGDPNSGGVALSAAGSGSNDGWFFDYSAGVLNFNDTIIPSGVSDINIYIVGYRYIGQTGAPTSGISTFSHLDLTVERNLDVGKQGGISTFRHNVQLLDNDKLQFGDSQDLSIYHNSTNSIIQDSGQGNLELWGENVAIRNANGGETLAGFTNNGSVDLFFNNYKKFETTSTGINVTGDGVFSGNVSIGGTLTYEDVVNVDSVGIVTARAGIRVTGGVIEAQAGENKIPSLYAAMGNLPSAGSYHGMFAHVHATGRGYFAHAGNWLELVNKETNGTVGTGTETFNIGSLTATAIDLNGDIDVDGHTNLDNVSITGVTTFTGNISGIATFQDIDVDGHTNLDNVSVAGITTFDNDVAIGRSMYHVNDVDTSIGFPTNGTVRISANNLNIAEFTALGTPSATFNTKINATGGTVSVAPTIASNTSPVLTIRNNTQSYHTVLNFQNTNATSSVIQWNNYGNTSTAGNLIFRSFNSPNTEYARFTGAGNFNLLTDLDVDGHTNLDNVSIAGVTSVASLTSGRVVTVGTGGKLEDSNNLTFDGNNLFVRGINIIGAGATSVLGADIVTRNFKATGVSTFVGDVQFDSGIKAGGSTGNNGQYLKSTGSGVAWDSFPSLRTRQTFTASSGQTTFSFAYTIGFLDVYVNGIKLTDAEFTATNGTTTVLAVGCFVGDIVELVAYNTVSASGGAFGIGNLVEDLSPQLGGNLDLFNKSITGTGNVNITGIVTATKFVGDGSSLSGIVASGSGVVVKDSGSLVGTAGTINFGNNLSVSAISGGSVTITATGGGGGTSGINTIGGVVNIANDLDVDGHTNLDNVNVAGVTTFANTVNGTIFNATTFAGNGDFVDIDVDGHTNLDNVSIAGVSTFAGAISVSDIRSDALTLKNASGGASYATFSNGGAAVLNWNNTPRLATSNAGITVTGTVAATSYTGDGSQLTGITGVSTANVRTNSLNVIGVSTLTNIDVDDFIDVGSNIQLGNAGVITATTFKGDGDFVELDVDGHTNLDNVSIAGVVTATTVNATTFNGSFVGNGSGLTGVVASGSGIVVKDDGSTVGTAGTVNFIEPITVTPLSAGIATVGINTVGFNVNNFDVSGIASFAQQINVTGDLNLTLDNGTIRRNGKLLFQAGAGNPTYYAGTPAGSKGDHIFKSFAGGYSYERFRIGGDGDIGLNGENYGTSGQVLTSNGAGAAASWTTVSGGGGTNVGITTNLSGSFTASAGSPSTINTFAYHDNDKVVEYTVYIKNGSDFQSQKLLAMRDGTTIHSTQFAVMFSSSLLVQCDATISSGNILLRATPETGVSGSTTYKIKREVM